MGTVNYGGRALRFPQQLHSPKLPISFKAQFFSHRSRIFYGVYSKKGKAFSFTLSCALKSETAKGKKGGKKKIVVPDSGRAPPLFDEEKFLKGGAPLHVRRSNGGGEGLFGDFPRRVFAGLSNLQLAVAGFMALGTMIDQGEAPAFYIEKLTLGLDHMFSSPIFLGALALLGASLMSCTSTTEIPIVKVARRWSFLNSSESIKEEYEETLPKTSVQDLGVTSMGAQYEVFLKELPLYAFKELAGRIAPIGVHLALLLLMSGGSLGTTLGDVCGPTPSEALRAEIHVNRFHMDYYESGEVSELHTDQLVKTVSVNDPLGYSGISMNQTDGSFSALQILKDSKGHFELAINGDKKILVAFWPVEDSNSPNVKGIKYSDSSSVEGIKDADLSNVEGIKDADSPNVKGISMLALDQQSIILYQKEGKLVGAIDSTGLDLKTDQEAPIIYAGIGAIVLTSSISYLSTAQIWALKDGTTVIIGGKGKFPDALRRLLDEFPDEPSPSTESDD